MATRSYNFSGSIATATEVLLTEQDYGRTSLKVGVYRSIVKIMPMSANCQYVIIRRTGHGGDDVIIPCMAASGAQENSEIDLEDLLGYGISVDDKEEIQVLGYQDSGGAEVVDCMITLSTNAGRNFRGVRVVGSAAAVASTLTASGGNLGAALDNSKEIALALGFCVSTTMLGARVHIANGEKSVFIPGHTDVGLGSDMYALSTDEMASMKGTNENHGIDILATGTDAADVQFYYFIYEYTGSNR